MKDRLQMHAAALQLPIGLEHAHRGVVDLVHGRTLLFEVTDIKQRRNNFLIRVLFVFSG